LQDQGGNPATPGAGYLRVFCKSDSLWFISDAGTVFHTITGTTSALAYRNIEMPLETGGGTCNQELWRGSPSLNFDADGETVYGSFTIPLDWDAASNLTLFMKVGNEIAEDDGDDVSFTFTVHGVGDGEVETDIGQTVAMTLNLTGGDEAINVVNLVSGIIDYDHGTYPIAAYDTVVLKGAVNLGGGGECTGPLHIISWGIRYTVDALGEPV
jgi:hypothetical protein